MLSTDWRKLHNSIVVVPSLDSLSLDPSSYELPGVVVTDDYRVLGKTKRFNWELGMFKTENVQDWIGNMYK